MSPENILRERYRDVRCRSERICAPLAAEDHVPQPVAEVSPPKWHLAHTSWFFESLVLQRYQPTYSVFHPRYAYLFNSYYKGAGSHLPRHQRGDLSRPTVAEVLAYRAHVDAAMLELLGRKLMPDVAALIELGLHHEQQHQELLLTDIKYILGHNPLAPDYDPIRVSAIDLTAEHDGTCPPLDDWLDVPAAMVQIGHVGPGFAFDNESPQHPVWVPATQLRRALVTNAEYLAFIQSGGYERHEFWHSDGWDWVQSLPQKAPLYWHPSPDDSAQWLHFTLTGVQPLPATAPVTHLSYFEAHAFCQWAGWRLPTEFEWEVGAPHFNWGRRWEWTQSAYQPYPGFKRSADIVGEYNGKFMVNQQVLRGASFATPPGHARLTYRNFFHANTRWQYSGLRPARDPITKALS